MRTSIFAVTILTLLLGCTQQPPFMGKWERHAVSILNTGGYTEVLELKPDGVLSLRPPPIENFSATGQFQVLDRERIRLTLYGATGICTARVQRTQLHFTDPTGRTVVYERAK